MDIMKDVSYRCTPLKTTLLYSTVRDRLELFAKTTPDKNALVVYDMDGQRFSITCSDLLRKSVQFAKGLLKLGIKKGHIVAESLPNDPNWLVCTFGIQIAGAIPLLFMFYRHDGTDVLNALRKSKHCTAILYDPGKDDINRNISRCFIQESSVRGGVKSAELPTLKYEILSRVPVDGKGVTTIEDILRYGEENPDIELPELDPDDVAAILLTSGSTGTPKAIQYTHLNLLELGRHFSYAFDMEGNDIYFNANSLNWGAASPSIFLFKGTTRVTCMSLLMFKSIHNFVDIIKKAIAEEKCSVAMLSVSCVKEIIGNDTNIKWASSLKTIVSGGAPVSSSCSGILDNIGQTFINLYGATEIGSISALRVTKSGIHEDYSVGIPLPGIEMKVVNQIGEILPVNNMGELYVRNCINHLGYHNDREMTRTVFTQTGWYKTDDIGCMREDGTFIVPGRKSDMIIVGEDLVSPLYLENIIQRHPGVNDVVVVPITDEQMFQQPCACIIPNECSTLVEDDLKEFFRKEFAIIPAYRGFIPKYYLFFEQFPQTPLGKLSRKLVLSTATERLNVK